MGKYFILLFLTTRLSVHGQNRVDIYNDSLIKEIRKGVNEINNDSASEKRVVVDLEEASAEGGELTKVYKGKYLCKGILIFYGETGKLKKEYYFSKGQMLFLYEQRYFYNAPISEKESKITKVEENRFYFIDGKLIHWVKGHGTVDHKYFHARMIDINNERKKYFFN